MRALAAMIGPVLTAPASHPRAQGTSKHPGFRLSAGMLATTKQENERLLRQMGVK